MDRVLLYHQKEYKDIFIIFYIEFVSFFFPVGVIDVLDGVVDGVINVLDGVVDGVINVLDGVINVLDGVVDGVIIVLDGVINVLDGVVENVFVPVLLPTITTGG